MGPFNEKLMVKNFWKTGNTDSNYSEKWLLWKNYQNSKENISEGTAYLENVAGCQAPILQKKILRSKFSASNCRMCTLWIWMAATEERVFT